MIHENLYKNFVNECYDNGKDLDEEMRKEIGRVVDYYATSTIMDSPQAHANALSNAVDKIMKLIYETRYEW